MKHFKKITAVALGGIMAASSCAIGLIGCDNPWFPTVKYDINELADEFALALMGDDAYSWNVLSATPEKSFGYERMYDPSWYFYSPATKADMNSTYNAFRQYKSLLNNVDKSNFSAVDQITYDSMEYILNTYIDYYGSKYAVDFTLIGGSYINAEGGYVADFASTMENYTFRTERDVRDLLSITVSTGEAFPTYLEYARARVNAGYPLYDYTVCAMQEYLDDIIELDTDYYLYELIDNKIDAADFLSDASRAKYKEDFSNALDNDFMEGVKTLSQGLNEYKGNVTKTNASYLAAYGDVGRKYYEWSFRNKTGLKNGSVPDTYTELMTAYIRYLSIAEAFDTQLDIIAQTQPEVYDDFVAYSTGEKAIEGFGTPQEALDYLKEAAKKIVPDLRSTPEINFKYMDETVASRTQTLAYYLHTPLDVQNSPEYITLNPLTVSGDGALDLLSVIAHEGYPGHLYAFVKAKEDGVKLISSAFSCITFSEGWAKYTEIAVLKDLMNSEDEATALYAEYALYDMITGYLSSALLDMQVNYIGITVDDLLENNSGVSEDDARNLVESLMEYPSMYIPYGYGMYEINRLHENAQASLGDDYNEIEFNGLLLSHGTGPTLTVARKITDDYIKSKK